MAKGRVEVGDDTKVEKASDVKELGSATNQGTDDSIRFSGYSSWSRRATISTSHTVIDFYAHEPLSESIYQTHDMLFECHQGCNWSYHRLKNSQAIFSDLIVE